MTSRPHSTLRERAAREPLDTDISDYSDEWCAGFLAGQVNALDAISVRCLMDDAPHISPSELKHMRPEVEALANFALTVEYGRPILDLCDYIRDLEEQLETLREALERARYRMRSRGITGEPIEEIDAALNPARCPVCEGLDQPGLLHNPEAPYCSERSPASERH